MFGEWGRRRKTRRKQAECVHDYRALFEYADYDFYMSRTDMVVLYCPKCNKEKDIAKNNWKIFLMKRNEYERYHSKECENEDKK